MTNKWLRPFLIVMFLQFVTKTTLSRHFTGNCKSMESHYPGRQQNGLSSAIRLVFQRRFNKLTIGRLASDWPFDGLHVR